MKIAGLTLEGIAYREKRINTDYQKATFTSATRFDMLWAGASWKVAFQH